jgi:hypothetical protein
VQLDPKESLAEMHEDRGIGRYRSGSDSGTQLHITRGGP